MDFKIQPNVIKKQLATFTVALISFVILYSAMSQVLKRSIDLKLANTAWISESGDSKLCFYKNGKTIYKNGSETIGLSFKDNQDGYVFVYLDKDLYLEIEKINKDKIFLINKNEVFYASEEFFY